MKGRQTKWVVKIPACPSREHSIRTSLKTLHLIKRSSELANPDIGNSEQQNPTGAHVTDMQRHLFRQETVNSCTPIEANSQENAASEVEIQNELPLEAQAEVVNGAQHVFQNRGMEFLFSIHFHRLYPF